MVRDLRYGDSNRQTIDIYVPADAPFGDAVLPKAPQHPSSTASGSSGTFKTTQAMIDVRQGGSGAAAMAAAAADGSAGASAAPGAPAAVRDTKGRPVVFFVHGGIWASGDKWYFAHLGTRLAQEGCLVVVLQYSLFPQAIAVQMVEEVLLALDWTMDHIERWGRGLQGCREDRHNLVAVSTVSRGSWGVSGCTTFPYSKCQPDLIDCHFWQQFQA